MLLRGARVGLVRSAHARRAFCTGQWDTKKIQRVVSIPVQGNQWIHFKLPSPKPTPSPDTDSSDDESERAPSDNKPLKSNPAQLAKLRGSSKEILLFNSMLGDQRSTQFMESRLFGWYEKMKEVCMNLWKWIAQGPPDSLRKTMVYPPAQWIFYRSITPSEKLFTNITISTTFNEESHRSLQFIYPASLSQTDYQDRLLQYIDEAEKYHTEWKKKNLYALPFSALLFVIPGAVNVPLYWNAYRWYTHWSALVAVNFTRASLLKKEPSRKSVLRSECSFRSDEGLDSIVKDLLREPSHHLTEQHIERLAEHFDLPESMEKELKQDVTFLLDPPSWQLTQEEFSRYWQGIRDRKKNIQKKD